MDHFGDPSVYKGFERLEETGLCCRPIQASAYETALCYSLYVSQSLGNACLVMQNEAHPSDKLTWMFIMCCLLVVGSILMLAFSGVEVDCHNRERKVAVYTAGGIYMLISFAFMGVVQKEPSSAMLLKATVYASAPVSFLIIMIMTAEGQDCKIDWAILAQLLSIGELLAFFLTFRSRFTYARFD